MKEVLKELNVEKLNICEPDGTVKMALFNSQNVPSLILEGEDLLPGHRANDGISGAMFYNNHGDECGGLIYGSTVDEEGKVEMGMSLTFDKWKQDQVVQIHLDKDGEQERYGISIYDRPDYSIKKSLDMINEFREETDRDKQIKLVEQIQAKNQRRLFVGHDVDGETKVSLYDSLGKEKIKLYINDKDEACMVVNGKKLPLKRLLKMI